MGSRKFLIVTELRDPSRVILQQTRPSNRRLVRGDDFLTKRGQMRSRRPSLAWKTWRAGPNIHDCLPHFHSLRGAAEDWFGTVIAPT